MAKIENDFLGLCDVKGACTVSANIWTKSDVMTTVSFESSSNKVKRAFNSKKRYSLENTVKLAQSNLKKDSTELLRALMYRAKITENKVIPIGHRGCVNIGVLNKA